MPHKTIWEEDGILWEYSGITTVEEVAQANTEFYRDRRSDHCKYQIFNGLGSEEITGTESEIRMLAAIDFGASRSIRNLKVALVVKPTMEEPTEHYMKTLKEMGSPWECRIFNSMEEARKWTNPD
tara:strand:+ start:23205 stop:23579 length:375 start_codon:yes stop_codon:yes gene_type:complete